MTIYTIGFTHKTAEEFFGLISSHRIRTLIDTRLNNNTQLAGFTKCGDLGYFLKRLCRCRYEYCPEYAPSSELLSSWRKKAVSWGEYVSEYTKLMVERGAVKDFIARFCKCKSVCLLCSEAEPIHCHRRLLAEMTAAELKLRGKKAEVVHI